MEQHRGDFTVVICYIFSIRIKCSEIFSPKSMHSETGHSEYLFGSNFGRHFLEEIARGAPQFSHTVFDLPSSTADRSGMNEAIHVSIVYIPAILQHLFFDLTAFFIHSFRLFPIFEIPWLKSTMPQEQVRYCFYYGLLCSVTQYTS
jgi:hypothetical protein